MLKENERFVVSEFKSAAHEYWLQGLNVVLVRSKKPLSEWKRWQGERQSESDFAGFPWKNADGFALIGGTQVESSLYIGAVDFDVKNVTEKAKLNGTKVLRRLPITQIEKTVSNGQHWVYYSHEKPGTISAYHNDSAVELLGENKLIIMAPSRGYQRLNDNTPTVVQNLESLFLEALEKPQLTQVPKETEFWFNLERSATKPYRGKNPICIQRLLKGVAEGERNEACIRLVCYFANFRMFKEKKVWRIIREWNKHNSSPLEEKELKTIFNSALKGEYVFGCSDPLLKKYCSDKSECPLASLTPLELINSEIERRQSVQLHPVIDFHTETGLSIGTLLGTHSKSLLFLGTKPFVADLGGLLKEEELAQSVHVIQPRFSVVNRVHSAQMLNVAGEFFKTGTIEFPPKNKVFKKVLGGVCHYWYHSENTYYTFVSCWIIATYFYPIFAFFPALRLQGERQTGKTTLLDVFHHLAWNATGKEVALRSADLFRTISDSRVTYLVDITKMSPKNEQYHDIVDIFEAGTESGGIVRRIDKESGEPLEYKIYSPKAVGTRYNLPFESKTIGIITEKAKDIVYAKRRAEMKFDPKLPETVALLIRAAIKYWPEIVEAYHGVKQTEKLNGRRFNYWSPILAVCKVFAPERYEKLLVLAERDAEENEKGDLLSEVEDAILTVLLTYKCDKDETIITILLKDLTEKITDLVPWVKSWHIVKSALRNLRITKKRYDSSRGIAYQIKLNEAHSKAAERKIQSEKAVLTQENMELVVKALHEETKDKEFATTKELSTATKLSEQDLKEILGKLQQEGKATQPHPDMWRLV
jgi:hypothetical protein